MTYTKELPTKITNNYIYIAILYPNINKYICTYLFFVEKRRREEKKMRAPISYYTKNEKVQ